MAKTRSITITVKEILHLADRLHARGVSLIGDGTDEQRRDLRTAAMVIKAMARQFVHADLVTLANGGQ